MFLSVHVILPTVDLIVPSFISLYLLKRRKERGGKKAEGESVESLETRLRDRAETLGLSLEQKTKGMKQRDKKVSCTNFYTTCSPFVLRTTVVNYCCISSQFSVAMSTI